MARGLRADLFARVKEIVAPTVIPSSSGSAPLWLPFQLRPEDDSAQLCGNRSI
jgi:hypothetical protein